MIQLNLLPDVKKEFIRAQRTKNTVIGVSILVTMGSVGLALLLAVVVYAVQPGFISVSQDRIDESAEKLRNVEDIEKYLTIQNQLETLPGLHDQKVTYGLLFDFLKQLNPAPPNDIRLSSLVVDEEEKLLEFSGVTSGFRSFSVFQDTLRNAEVTYTDESGEEVTQKLFVEDGIVIGSQVLTTSQGEQQLSFTISATYEEAIFSPSTKSPVLKVPNIQTSQSITGTPNRASAPLFDENAAPENGEGQ